jgi:hypothetical protein
MCLPRATPAAISASAAGKVFFKCLDGVGGLGVMARSGGELAVAEAAQLPAQRVGTDREVEFIPDPLRKIDEPPAHHAMDGWHRPGLDDRRERLALLVVQARCRAGQLPVDQAVRPLCVEPQHPVTNDLPADPADPRRLVAPGAVMDRRQRQQTARLVRIPRPPRQTPEIIRRKVRTQRNRHRHGELLPFAYLRITNPPLWKSRYESAPTQVGITRERAHRMPAEPPRPRRGDQGSKHKAP